MIDPFQFEAGDPVTYANQHKARVVSTYGGSVKIQFDDLGLIPPQMDVPAHSLSPDFTRTRIADPATSCPSCFVPWKETPGFRFSYFDCPKCGAKKEDFIGVPA